VREREEKADICERVGITHFVDDQLEVLVHLTSVPYRYLFTGGLGMNQPPSTVPTWATVVATWPQLVGLLTA
jgi:hypothetical protein